MACARCYERKKQCDRRDPCSTCVNLGLECKPRQKKTRKHYNGGKKRAARTKKRKVAQGAISDVLELAQNNTDNFHSPQVDLTMIKMFSKLSPSHFALQCAVKILVIMAYRKASMTLMHLTTSFATTMGVTHFFPSLDTPKNLRQVKRDFTDIPIHVMRKHDEAVGITDAKRIILAETKEFAPEGALIVASHEAWHLLNLDESALQTAFHAQDAAIKVALDPSDYNRLAHSALSILVKCETVHSGPQSTCTENITFHSPVEGNILGHMYSTIWLGTNGLDGVNIQEFVPLNKVANASAKIIEGSEISAAEAIMALKN